MNQLDRNIADAIANPFEGCEDTYDGIVGNLDQVCISRRSAARMPNYDFIYTMCRYDLSNGDLYVSMPVPEDERYWVVHVHNNNTNVAFKINNLEIESDRYELLVTNKENINSNKKKDIRFAKAKSSKVIQELYMPVVKVLIEKKSTAPNSANVSIATKDKPATIAGLAAGNIIL